ncbi:3'-5' exoribonuclease YhaM family protein [Thermosipho atlanticus]|uniref:3'-5' exoribonuclease n=1 Tax=Thermosipho atlanticus DSM 15807 TaxID=1123380 RepID=A0A1M5RQC7_9BACT|nr:HD domain-containing protein [Thermosipho atlanticus]SHH28406.1 3'-5' exoribonuclease [Thermosipho atlanticus DSM 15807]
MKLPKEIIEKYREPFISELGNYINSELEIIVKVKSKRLMENKNGQKYLLLTFEDKTGILRAIDWFNAETNDSKVNVGNIIRTSGKVVVYDGRLQFNLLQDSPVIVLKEGEYSIDRFVMEAKRSIDEIMDEIKKLIDSIKNVHLKRLLNEFFERDESFLKKFKSVPAGAKVHHNYVGGLAEHSSTVAQLCDSVCKTYKNLDRDLLIAGALLHDIGKINDYKVTSKGIEITTQGELIGHIVSGYEMVKVKVKKMKVPEDISTKLLHMIISHHGELEWGSPVVPKTPEAYVLHMIENMDSKLNRIFAIKEKELEGNPEKDWSDYDPNLGRRFYLKHELD